MAAAGTSHLAAPQRALKEGRGVRWLWFVRCGRIKPSRRSAISMEFHTLGLGSSLACNSPADATIRLNSFSNAEHFGHALRWARCSSVLPSSTSAKLCCSSTQFIRPLPESTAALAVAAAPTPLLRLLMCSNLPYSRLPGLFGSIHLEQVAQLHSRLMQLRFAVSDRASHQTGDLIMLVTFHIVKYKNRPVAGRQIIYCPLQLQSVYRSGQSRIVRPEVLLRRIILSTLGTFFQRNYGKALLPQVHQYHIYRQTMQPGGKSRLSTERPNLTIELQKCFLSQILSLGSVCRHPQTK